MGRTGAARDRCPDEAPGSRRSEVDDLQAAPDLAQVLGCQPAMALVGGRLAAQECGRSLEHYPVELRSDAALPDQRKVSRFVLFPGDLLVLIRLEHVGSGSQ